MNIQHAIVNNGPATVAELRVEIEETTRKLHTLHKKLALTQTLIALAEMEKDNVSGQRTDPIVTYPITDK